MVDKAMADAGQPWLQHYNGLPSELPSGPTSMMALFRAAVCRSPDAEALVYFDASWTWSAVDRQSDAVARLLADVGVKPGDHVASLI